MTPAPIFLARIGLLTLITAATGARLGVLAGLADTDRAWLRQLVDHPAGKLGAAGARPRRIPPSSPANAVG